MMYAQRLYEESADKKLPLGTVRELADGRRFVYCQATAAAIGAGLCVSKAVAPQACTVAAADAAQNLVGSRKVYLTLTGTPTLNQYEDGFMIVSAGTGIGEMYKIAGNSADDIPATGRVTVNLCDPLANTHVAASTTVDLFENPYKSVLINPAVAAGGAETTQEKPLGVTLRAVTASYYFWAQTWGLCSLVLDIDSAAGGESNECIIQPGTTEGRGFIVHDTHVPGHYKLGEIVESADQDDAEAALVYLMIS